MTTRCAHCGGTISGLQGDHCSDCGQPIQRAPAPIPRGPAGWCERHPEGAVTGVCARCGVFTCVQCEVSVQGVRYCASCRDQDQQVFTAPVAWEERGNVGLLRGWWRTTAAVTTRPTVFFEQLPTDGGMGPAITFGLVGATLLQVSNTALALLGAVGNLVVLGGPLVQGAAAGSLDTQLLMTTLIFTGTKLLTVLMAPLLTLLLYLVVAILQHLCLRLVDAGAERGIGATLKVACYALGVGWVGGLIPYFGPLLIFPAWWTALMVVGTSRVHRRSSTRTLVVAMPTLLLCLAPVAACLASALLGILLPL